MKQVNAELIEQDLGKLLQIGTLEDKTGINRVAYTYEEDEAHGYIKSRMIETGLETRIDNAGNLYGLREGNTGKKIVIGSHLDSVPNGGNYDGALGVVIGLEAARILEDTNLEHGLEIVAFRAEESSRFGSSCIGSKLVTEFLTAEETMLLKDNEGLTLYQAMLGEGFNPENLEMWNKEEIELYLEPHIEQGDVLTNDGYSIGVVTGIRAPVRYEVHVIGEWAHSGATPMKDRKDALVAASRMISDVSVLANIYERQQKQTVATVGYEHVPSGAINKVPGETSFGLDIRGIDEEHRDSLEKKIIERFDQIAEEHRVTFSMEERERGIPVALDELDYKLIELAAEKLNIPTMRLPSGAGHDAQYVALYGIPTAMIFVSNTNGSHNQYELVNIQQDVVPATTVLAQTVVEAVA